MSGLDPFCHESSLVHGFIPFCCVCFPLSPSGVLQHNDECELSPPPALPAAVPAPGGQARGALALFRPQPPVGKHGIPHLEPWQPCGAAFDVHPVALPAPDVWDSWPPLGRSHLHCFPLKPAMMGLSGQAMTAAWLEPRSQAFFFDCGCVGEEVWVVCGLCVCVCLCV